MKKRDRIYNKYNGLCAYSGTPLKKDWQIDHIHPKCRAHFYDSEAMKKCCKIKGDDINDEANLVPCQRIINHYKRALDLDTFRNNWLGRLHVRLRKLPKNPRTEKSIRHKEYLLEVAELFGITENKPFGRMFYFETIEASHTKRSRGE